MKCSYLLPMFPCAACLPQTHVPGHLYGGGAPGTAGAAHEGHVRGLPQGEGERPVPQERGHSRGAVPVGGSL